MKICILAGGPSFLVPASLPVGENIMWLGVDRGVRELRQRGIEANYLFGDFDSLTEEEKQWQDQSNVFSFSPEKAKTDLELALDWAFDRDPSSIEIYGATGGRLDHEWANLQLLRKGSEKAIETIIIDRQNRITAKPPGHHVMVKEADFPYVSFLPYNKSINGLTLEGFKYCLDHADIEAGSTLTVSNELIGESGTYSFESGIVLVIRSRDHS